MKFNLAEYRRISVVDGPYKSLTEAQLELLNNGLTTVSGISVASETLAVVCDLGARFKLDSIYYYRAPATSENIAIYGKQGADTSHPWVELDYTQNSGYVKVDLSAVDDRYEFVRVIHTVTAGVASSYELQIYNSDDSILFGQDGTAAVYSVDSGTSNMSPEKISVYNSTEDTQTFYCLIDGDDPDSVVLNTSPTITGTFAPLYGRGISMPVDFDWSAGQFEDTLEDSGNVVLVSGTTGLYYTPVIDISSLSGRRFFWSATTSGGTEIDSLANLDSVATVMVRFSNVEPTDVGWESGQMSNDSNWDVVTGALEFEPYDNNHVLNPKYLNYFQAKVEFISPIDGLTPILHSIGIEEALSLTIPAKQSDYIYIKSEALDHIFGRESNLLVWYFESNNELQ